ncbi:anti-sigma factor RsiW [Oikeobacillus pervagus]|uniref:Anti-sigma factor RsiW n=1 Tax=Oikeobacillus pervagus TaxID=1325931 RepID=A0AAJ1T4X1_9BACI|nr:anti-sigma factor [Oikeobacillus pervagus]MDQ0216686.1 anti-sigma factor RsiW [Oikeobacillus pervagus]
MKSCPKEIIDYMHDDLDGEINEAHHHALIEHLETCEDCKQHYYELKKTATLVRSISHIQAPKDFTDNVLARLPKEKKKIGFQRWFQQHPFLTAASLFLILMMGSFFTTWKQDQQLAFTHNPNLVVDGNTVVVPEGEVVKGDLEVRNGNVRVEGEVQGDLTVINGEKYMASAGKVTGDIEEIDAAFQWLWYEIKKVIVKVVD